MTRLRKITKPIFPTNSLALMLAACGGGGGGNPPSAHIQSALVQREGRTFDGPIVGATIYVDANSNGRIDDADIRLGVSDEEGMFSGEVDQQYADKPLIADLSGAHDTDAPHITLSGIWRAPDEATVISPLTELMVREGLTARQLALRVGLPDNIDVSQMDPFDIIPQNVSYAQQILALGRFVADHLSEESLPDIIEVELDLHENHPLNKPVFNLRGGELVLTSGYGDNDAFEIRDGRIWFAPGQSPDYEDPTERQFELRIERTVDGETQVFQLTINIQDIELERNENEAGSGVGFHEHKKSDYRDEDLPSPFTQNILGQSYWASPADKPLTLTWSISLRDVPQTWIDQIDHLTSASIQSIKTQVHIDLVRQLIIRATEEIEEVANIEFIEVDANPNTGQTGDLSFWFVDYIKNFSGFAYYPSAIASNVFFQASTLAAVTTLENFQYSFVETFRKIYLHEIGHALGLSHPFEELAEWPGDEKYRYSVETLMSYSRTINTHGLKPADIEALQWLYGAPGEHGTGAEFLPEIV